MEREAMEFDVVIVGAGPAGLAAACRIMQVAAEKSREVTVCVVEKGSEVGAHILSGAVLEPRAMNELFPDWEDRGAPLPTTVTEDKFFFYTSATGSIRLPNFFIPKPTHNHGNLIVSMGNVCRWMAEQAESLGVEVYPGFTASEVLFHDDGRVKGIATGDMGVGADGEPKDTYTPGMELHARYTLFAEGCRGHLGKQLIRHFDLDKDSAPQHYGIGIKEIWEIPAEKHQEGLVVHGLGWPLSESKSSGLWRLMILGGWVPKTRKPGALSGMRRVWLLRIAGVTWRTAITCRSRSRGYWPNRTWKSAPRFWPEMPRLLRSRRDSPSSIMR